MDSGAFCSHLSALPSESRAHMRKEMIWQDPTRAAEYDRQRFGTPLKRWKHRRDEALLLGLMRRGLESSGLPLQGSTLFDMPCGTGRLMPVFASAGLRVLGLDVSRPMMLARPWSQDPEGVMGMLQGSALELPMADRSVDASLCMRFLFHLDDADERIAVLRELARVTRGPILGQVRYRQTFKHMGRYVRSRVGLSSRYMPSHSRAEIAAELQAAGLEMRKLLPVSHLFSDKALFLAIAVG